MHYIIGTEVIYKDRVPLKGVVTSSTFQRRVNNVITKQLKPDVVYYLYNISTNAKNGVDYTFVSKKNHEAIKITFNSVNAADKAISELRKESLPDYFSEGNQRSD